jgi:metal-dependent hydrolase (beta-lactamase superfamily II)
MQELHVDLSDVKEVVLTHHHWDHVRGLMTLRREMMKKSPSALSVVHVARGIFYSRPGKDGEANDMVAMKKDYEGTGGGLDVQPERRNRCGENRAVTKPTRGMKTGLPECRAV